MSRFRSLWLVAPLFVGACSFINAPDPIDLGSGGAGGSGGSGGSGAGTGGTTTTDTTSSTTTPMGECGDGKLDAGEECDDDNTMNGDGCRADCGIEDGWECTGDAGMLSVCQLLCGNGTLNAGEQCDDMGMGDPNPAPGNQDACSATCQFQEFDIEEGADTTVVHQLPLVAFRNDSDQPSAYILWHTPTVNKIVGREYKMDGTYKKGTGAVEIAAAVGNLNPDGNAKVFCTASSNRSIIGYRSANASGNNSEVFFRKIESDGSLTAATTLPFISTTPFLSCASAPNNAFILAMMVQGSTGLFDIMVQPFASSALPQGMIVDAGDALIASQLSSWGIAGGFLVSWVPDPGSATSPIVAQQLNDMGGVEQGSLYTLTDPTIEMKVAEPSGASIGMQGQFALVYSRDSMPDMMGTTHREIALRIFQNPTSGGDPIVVSSAAQDQREPTIVVNPSNGKFVIVWTSFANNAENVQYRVFNATGSPASDEMTAPEVLTGKQTKGSAMVDPPTGDVLITWDNFVPNSNKPHKVSAKIFPGLLK